MWPRTAEVTISPDGVRFRHGAVTGPEGRLRAALLRVNPAGEADSGATLVGAGWQGQDGATSWGWPDGEGQMRLWPGTDRPQVCSLLPPALSLALAFRRSGTDLGARVLVIGDGFLARIARAAASAVGLNIREPAVRDEQTVDEGVRPDVVIEATGEPRNLDRAVERCAAWGRVYSLGGALVTGPLDYYPHVHCRALTVTHVPDRPILLAGEEPIVERGAVRLAEFVREIAPAPEETVATSVLPEGTPARLALERSGWGLLLLDE
jgi:hypothetical protein